MANGTIKCDGCGRFSRHRQGEYSKPDGTSGNINSKGRDDIQDYCDECAPKYLPEWALTGQAPQAAD